MVFIIVTLAFIWVVAFFLVNDLTLPSKDISSFKNVLVIFPHADDEVLSAGGLIRKLASRNSNITYLILTKGEKGTERGILDLRLKDIRTTEAQEVGKILRISHIIQKDLGDGILTDNADTVKDVIVQTMEQVKPDLVITYDLSGQYGHPDHMITSSIVTDLLKYKYEDTHLWYISQPKIVTQLAKLPVEMAKDETFMAKRMTPTHKIFVGQEFMAKMKAVDAYKSQYTSFRKAIPGDPLPMWLVLSPQLYEYFYIVK